MVKSTQKSSGTHEEDLRKKLRDSRILVSRNMKELCKDQGMKRVSSYVGTSLYDHDIAPILSNAELLACYLSQIHGHKTIQEWMLIAAVRHILNIEPLSKELMTPRLPRNLVNV